MGDYIRDVVENYMRVKEILDSRYEEINGYEFYRYLFPNNENQGELNTDYSKPNAIYLYKDEKDSGTRRRVRRRIMLNDTWKEDYINYVECNPLTFCSGLSYRGRANRLEKAQHMNALIFDLDSVGENELMNVLNRIGKDSSILRTLPQPTFIVMSGTGLHIYYVFEEPIELFPNVKIQLKKFKYDLTFRMWEHNSTSKEKQIQYQSINQGFRMVGSINDKYDLPIIAFKTGDRVSLEYVNSYARYEENQVDINKKFRPSQYSLEEAKEKFPDWYNRVIVEGNRNQKKWDIKRDLYDWWLRKSGEIKGGHRYFYLMCMAIYGVKCNIPKKEVEKDMRKIFGELKEIEHSNELTEEDINSALETYDRGFYNFTIDDIEKLTDIRIERNKRNYRTQKQHIEVMNFIRDNITHKDKDWRNKEGRPSKENLVKEYIAENSNDNPTDIARALGISRTTVYKYLDRKKM